jgi:hypothetical protein
VEETKDKQLHRKQASKILLAIHLKSISQVCIISSWHLHTNHTACLVEKSWLSQVSVCAAVSVLKAFTVKMKVIGMSSHFISLLLKFSLELRIKYPFEVGLRINQVMAIFWV